MIQEILTYIIVGMAVVYVAYKTILLFAQKKKSDGCGGSCSCDAKKQFSKKL